MEIRDARTQDSPSMVDLFMQAYEEERKSVPALPIPEDIRPRVEPRMQHMLDNHQGVIAVENGIIKGYLTYILGGPLFGTSECAFVPLLGHAAAGGNRSAIYQRMLNEAGGRWVKAHKLSWVVTAFEHDRALERFWFKNGFGQRCADAILMPEDHDHNRANIDIVKATDQNIDMIADLHREHVKHYPTSPIFMPADDGDPWSAFKTDAHHEDTHVWIARMDASPVGYIRIEPEGESFISLTDDMMNVTSAFVNPKMRGRGVATALLEEVQRFILSHPSYHRLGVDYETINPSGRGFWERYFTPYTKTVTRRIDEHIIQP